MDVDLNNLAPMVTAFMMVLTRLTGVFLLAPVFSSRLIPLQVKAMIAVVISFAMMPVVAGDQTIVPVDGLAFALLMTKELIIGLALGFAMATIFAAVSTGAQFIDLSSGFAMANIADPLNNTQASVFGAFYAMVGTLVFMAIDGPEMVVAGFVASYSVVGIDAFPNLAGLTEQIVALFTEIFVNAFRIAAPVMVTLFLTDAVLGIVARVVPQMNVFFVGIPLKIAMAMVAIIVSLPMFIEFFGQRFEDIAAGVAVLAQAGG